MFPTVAAVALGCRKFHEVAPKGQMRADEGFSQDGLSRQLPESGMAVTEAPLCPQRLPAAETNALFVQTDLEMQWPRTTVTLIALMLSLSARHGREPSGARLVSRLTHTLHTLQKQRA